MQLIIIVLLLLSTYCKRVSYLCPVNLFWTGQTCLPCQTGCKCNSYMGCKEDIVCNHGYALQTIGIKQCIQCPIGCDICILIGINGFICNQCSDGYQLINNICIPLSFNPRMGNVKFFGFGLWGIPQWSIPNLKIPDNAIYKTMDCIERDTSTSFCKLCPIGSFLNEVLQCEQCGLNCKLCTNRGMCNECQIGYYYTLQNNIEYTQYFYGSNQCIQCNDPLAATCNNSTILSCQQGSFILNNQCINCNQGCKQCNSQSTCNECYNGYYLDNYQCNYCQGNSNGINICLQCQNLITCEQCIDGYLLVNDQCVQIPNDIGCETFKIKANQIVCSICLNGYYLHQGKCYTCQQQSQLYDLCTNLDEINTNPNVYPTQCITDYDDPTSIQNYFMIQQEDQVINTNVCIQNQNGCIKMLINTNSQCSECATGWTLYQQKCYNCQNILHCQECTYQDSLQCTKCQSNMYLNNNQCSNCLQGCDECQSSDICQQCSIGYYLDGQKCTKCSVTNCQQCNNNICTQCISQFFLYSNTCQLCPPGCSDCQSTKGKTCITCLDGFYLKNEGCYPGSQYCAQHNDDGSCEQCVYGAYEAENNQCLPCISLGAGYVCEQNADIYCFNQIIISIIVTLLLIQ